MSRFFPGSRLILISLSFLLLAVIPILAVHDAGLIDLDGNIVNDGATDWADLFSGGNPGGTPLTLPTDAISSVFIHDGYAASGGGQHDGTAPDASYFATGAKDTLDIPSWQCSQVNSPTPKDDIEHTYAVQFSPSSGNKAGHKIIYLAMERFANEGAGEIAFWILQDPTVGCTAPSTGAANFTGAHMEGDLLIVSEFTNGGVINSINVYEWTGGALNTTAIATGVDCGVASANDNVCGKVNTGNITAPWAEQFKNQSVCTSNCTVETSEFFEMGLDATALVGASFCSSGILGDTRTSPSLTATLKDYTLGSLSCMRQPTISTLPSAGGDVGVTLTDSATLSGGINPTGNITFNLYPPSDPNCSGTPAFIDTVTVSSGNGTYNTSTGFTSNAAGIWHWIASYSGDSNNNAASSSCTAEAVTATDPAAANPTITTTPSAGGTVGVTLTDSATLSGGINPTGNITFYLYPPSDPNCSGTPAFTDTVTVSSGNGIYNTSTGFVSNAAGIWHWTASYSGDSNNNAVLNSCTTEPVTATEASPQLVTTPSAGGTIGVTLTDSATLSGGFNPTGNITFKLYDPNDPTCSGTAAFSNTVSVNGNGTYSTSMGFTSNAAGIWHWTASYSGDSNNNAASSNCADESITINEMTVGGDPPIWGDIVAFPTPEWALGRDLNGDGDTSDTVLRFKNLRTGEVVNTGIPVSGMLRSVDLYEDTVVFVLQESSFLDSLGFNFLSSPLGTGPIGTYNLRTGKVQMLGAWGSRPTIYQNIISISGNTVRYYDLKIGKLVDTGIPAENQALWGRRIVYAHVETQKGPPMIYVYDLDTGTVVQTGIAGSLPAIYENTIAFTTRNGDQSEGVIGYYNLSTKKLTNTGEVGVDPAMYGQRIVFESKRHIRYFDMESGRAFDTGELGFEPDIYEGTITYFVWERVRGEDLNGDRDQKDPIVLTHQISPSDRLLAKQAVPQTSAAPTPSAKLSINRVLSSQQAHGMRFVVQGVGVESLQVKVYDLQGTRVFDSSFTQGTTLSWDLATPSGGRAANGVYLYVINARGADGKVVQSRIQKLLLLR